MPLLSIVSGAASRMRSLVVASVAEEEKRDLRRFDTVLPGPDVVPKAGAEGGGSEGAAASEEEEPSLREKETANRVSELLANVGRLKGMLEEREAIDDEGARLQRALQRQEEEDSLKMIQLFRKQDEAYSAELVERMTAVEEATILRMRQEKEEEVSEVSALAPAPSHAWLTLHPPA